MRGGGRGGGWGGGGEREEEEEELAGPGRSGPDLIPGQNQYVCTLADLINHYYHAAHSKARGECAGTLVA